MMTARAHSNDRAQSNGPVKYPSQITAVHKYYAIKLNLSANVLRIRTGLIQEGRQ